MIWSRLLNKRMKVKAGRWSHIAQSERCPFQLNWCWSSTVQTPVTPCQPLSPVHVVPGGGERCLCHRLPRKGPSGLAEILESPGSPAIVILYDHTRHCGYFQRNAPPSEALPSLIQAPTALLSRKKRPNPDRSTRSNEWDGGKARPLGADQNPH